jgi:hypothetical protein
MRPTCSRSQTAGRSGETLDGVAKDVERTRIMDLSRVVNAMRTAKEFAEAGDDVELVFDGAGTQWPGVLANRQMEMVQFNRTWRRPGWRWACSGSSATSRRWPDGPPILEDSQPGTRSPMTLVGRRRS